MPDWDQRYRRGEHAPKEPTPLLQYLQRDLFSEIRAGVKTGGTVIAAIHLNDGKAEARPSNPSFLLEPGELREFFRDWEIGHYREGASEEEGHHHDTAFLICRKASDRDFDKLKFVGQNRERASASRYSRRSRRLVLR